MANKVTLKRLIVATLSSLFIVGLHGCALSLSPVELEQTTAEPPTIVSTEIGQGSLIIKTILPQSLDYIFYVKYNPENNQDEIWAVNPQLLSPILVVTGDNLYLWGQSPFNSSWLLTEGNNVYIANSNFSNIRAVYQTDEYVRVRPFWIDDDEAVLLNAFDDLLSHPDIYRIDDSSGSVTKLFPEGDKFIQNTFPLEKTFLLASWTTDTLEVVLENGEIELFLNNYSIVVDPFDQDQIQYIRRLQKYLLVAKEEHDDTYKLRLASITDEPQVLFDPGSGGIDEFSVSPNEQYAAVTSTDLEGIHLYIFDVDELRLIYNWPYPYNLGSGYLAWSPDSQSIGLLYSETDVGVSEKITSGIQMIDIKTGEAKIILKENIIQIVGWYYIP